MSGQAPDLTLHLATLVLALIAFAIAKSDFSSLRIPNVYSLALAICGLVFVVVLEGSVPVDNLTGSCAIGLLFWAMRWGYAKLRGRAGLGFGDVKMASAGAIWLSPWFLSTFLFIACVTCIVYSIGKGLFTGREALQQRIPFGPFLSVGLVVTWLLERYSLSFLFS